MNTTVQAWIRALRPRTLPLSLSALFLGSGLAAAKGSFSWPIFLLAVFTGMLLQALSDFANDYGDAMNNLDGADRLGPKRTVSSGEISPKNMLLGMLLVACLIVITTICLFSLSFGTNWIQWILCSFIIITAMLAAVFYTVGKNPYGYRAKGDYYVFVYFGFVSVMGSYYLFTNNFTDIPIFPAIAAGAFATAVLNINNTRDMDADKKNGKITIANKLGKDGARKYHICLIGTGVLAWFIYFILHFNSWHMLLLLLTLPLIISAYKVYTNYDANILDKQLRITALSTSVFHIVMAVAIPLLV